MNRSGLLIKISMVYRNRPGYGQLQSIVVDQEAILGFGAGEYSGAKLRIGGRNRPRGLGAMIVSVKRGDRADVQSLTARPGIGGACTAYWPWIADTLGRCVVG
jgi:hypothetical protein